MTLKDLSRILEHQPTSQALQALKGTTFAEFWDAIGWPEKDGKPMPLFDYEREILDALESHKLVYILKATGLGITELILRWIAWQALKDDHLQGRDVFVLCGPREQLAITLINRIKGLFPNERFDTDKTTVILNGCKIQAYPSHALAAIRGMAPKVVFMDEAAFFPTTQALEARAVAERYIAKSDPHIILCSTPYVPGDLMHQVMKEEPSVYHKIFLPYTAGLGKIFTKEEIDKARLAASFEREYNLKFGFGVGNVFKAEDVDDAVVEYPLDGYRGATCTMGVDPSFGLAEQSSAFAWCTVAIVDGFVRFYDVEQGKGLSFAEAENKAKEKTKKYNPQKIYVDGANPTFIKAVKTIIGEYEKYDELSDDELKWQRCVPVSFSGESPRAMLSNFQQLVSHKKVQIHPKFSDLILQMRSAVVDDTGKLDKSFESLDLIDAARLALRSIKLGRAD